MFSSGYADLVRSDKYIAFISFSYKITLPHSNWDVPFSFFFFLMSNYQTSHHRLDNSRIRILGRDVVNAGSSIHNRGPGNLL